MFIPSRSTFTRVQRLCCCMAILYLTMISNCMWYQSDSEEEDDNRSSQSAISIGPINMTTRELYVSVVSSLMVVPPILLITTFYAKAQAKPRKKANNYEINAQGALERDQQRRKGSQLPYWFIYIAYILVVAAVVSSAFFTILYSFEWGKEKSEGWLVAFLLCFFESVLIIQPLKVLTSSPVKSHITFCYKIKLYFVHKLCHHHSTNEGIHIRLNVI